MSDILGVALKGVSERNINLYYMINDNVSFSVSMIVQMEKDCSSDELEK